MTTGGQGSIKGGGRAARLGLGLLSAAGALLPRGAVETLVRWGFLAGWRASGRFRRALEANGRHLLGPGAGTAEHRTLALEQIGSFARFISELASLNRRQDQSGALVGRAEGAEHLDRALALGRGLVAVSLHMGNYELAAAGLAGRIPSGVTVVYDRDPAGLWEGRRERWRREARVEGLAIGGSPFFAVEALARLRSGGAVLLAGDQVEARLGEEFPFLGGMAVFSLFPARLALAADAPIVPAFCVRGPSGAYDIRIEPAILPAGRDPRAITEELLAVYGRQLLAHPGQWLMMREFWR